MRKIEKVAKYRNILLKEALEKRLMLLKLSKKKKWNNQLIPEHVLDLCPFCIESSPNNRVLSCNSCLCPPDICNNYANDGYIHKIKLDIKNNPFFYKNKIYERLQIIIGLFDYWIRETENEIKRKWIEPINKICNKCVYFYSENQYCGYYFQKIYEQMNCKFFK